MSSGRLIDQPVEHGVAGQTEDEVDPVLVAPLHHFGAAIMAVAANGDAGVGPMTTDHAHETSQMIAYLLPRRALARPQQYRHRAS